MGSVAWKLPHKNVSENALADVDFVVTSVPAQR